MHVIRFSRGTCRVGAGVMLCAQLVGAPSQGLAQQPVPVPAPSTAVPAPVVAYRGPTIALVQPAGTAIVPPEKPVVVFRFAQGEPNDPIDLASFAVACDGSDRTALFQVTASEAWGPLVAPGKNAAPGEMVVAPGVHHVTARVCSARGACAFTTSTITIASATAESPVTLQPVAGGLAADSASNSVSSRRRRILDALLAAARKLLTP